MDRIKTDIITHLSIDNRLYLPFFIIHIYNLSIITHSIHLKNRANGNCRIQTDAFR